MRRWISGLIVAAVASAGAASAAEVRVMISAGFHGVYAELGPAFERATGHKLVTAVTTNARERDAGAALLKFLSSPEAAPVITKAGLSPSR